MSRGEDDDRRQGVRQQADPDKSVLEQRVLTEQAEQLLGIQFTGKGPEASFLSGFRRAASMEVPSKLG